MQKETENKELKIFFFHYGCGRRLMDLNRTEKYLVANGCKIITKAEEADYVFITTCGTFSKAVNTSFEIIDKYRLISKNLIILGCMPEIVKEEYTQRYDFIFVSPKNMEKLDEIFPNFKVKFDEIKEDSDVDKIIYQSKNLNETEETSSKFKNNIRNIKNKIVDNITFTNKEKNKLVSIRLCYGCLNNCAYCTKTRATGRLKSRKPEDCINEYKKLLEKGYRHFQFLSEDTGSYGVDIGTTFPDLLNKFIEANGKLSVKWQLPDINPNWAIKYQEELIDILKKGIVTRIGLPIQSGSNRILKLMKRKYDINDISEIFFKFKKIDPELKIPTHIIVGFPSETEEDFQMTLDVIKRIMPYRVLVSKYTEHKGILAESITPKVEPEVIDERYKRILLLIKENNIQILRSPS